MANKLPTTSFGRLARELKRRPMTRKQITEFLLRRAGQTYEPGVNHDYYNSALYGTTSRVGFLELYGVQSSDGRWQVEQSTPETGPFTPLR